MNKANCFMVLMMTVGWVLNLGLVLILFVYDYYYFEYLCMGKLLGSVFLQ